MPMQSRVAFYLVWLMSLSLGHTDEPQIFCYYNGEGALDIFGNEQIKISEIDPNLCTHLVYSSVGITEDGNVRLFNPNYDILSAGFQRFNALREQNEKLKTLVSASGQYKDSPVFSKIAGNTSLRSTYAKNVVNFLLEREFDGFNVRWYYPTLIGGSPDDVQNYVLLLKELRERFDEHKLILTVELEGIERYASRVYDIPGISENVDFVLLTMTHHRFSDATLGHIAPLFPASRELSSSERILNIDSGAQYWLNQSIPAKKLILGIKFSGMRFNLNNSAKHSPGSPAATDASKLALQFAFPIYTEICILTSSDGWTTEWDEEQRVPYSYDKKQWISYDNVRSLTEKARYVRTMGLGGVMVWGIDQDDLSGKCGERFPLMNALNRELRGKGSSTISESNIATTAKVDTTDSPKEAAKKTCARMNSRYIRHSENCAKFWLCLKISEGLFNAKLFSCGDDLYFDIFTNSCKNKNLVDCH